MKPILESLAFLALLGGHSFAAGKPRLNIVSITADDMNHDSAGGGGGPIKDLTPNMARLAAEYPPPAKGKNKAKAANPEEQ